MAVYSSMLLNGRKVKTEGRKVQGGWCESLCIRGINVRSMGLVLVASN